MSLSASATFLDAIDAIGAAGPLAPAGGRAQLTTTKKQTTKTTAPRGSGGS